MESDDEFLARINLLKVDHPENGWPAIQMKDISRLLSMNASLTERVRELEAQGKVLAQAADRFQKAASELVQERDALKKALDEQELRYQASLEGLKTANKTMRDAEVGLAVQAETERCLSAVWSVNCEGDDRKILSAVDAAIRSKPGEVQP